MSACPVNDCKSSFLPSIRRGEKTVSSRFANAANSGLLSEEGDIDTIIKKQLGENNPFAENVLRTIQQELVSSGRDVTLTKIRTDPQGFAKQLTHGIENILRPRYFVCVKFVL